MVEVFKTSVNDQITAGNVLRLIKKDFPFCEISFDLEDCDRILRIESEDLDAGRIIDLLKGAGVSCDVL